MNSLSTHDTAFTLQERIHRPDLPVTHRESEFASEAFESLRRMQDEHFWYRGRHRFLLHAVTKYLPHLKNMNTPRVADFGGGCGGWLGCLIRNNLFDMSDVGLADSSIKALTYAADSLPENVSLYEIDLLQLPWQERWDIIFLLDVLEHIPDDQHVLDQIWNSLAPGGLLFVTTPAIQRFWTWNDTAVHHQRRYSKRDFRQLAAHCGYEMLATRYFMFFLSPMLLLSRWLQRPPKNANSQQLQNLIEQTHRVPRPIVNGPLSAIFSAETPLGHYVPFPWGTSILGVFRKPDDEQ